MNASRGLKALVVLLTALGLSIGLASAASSADAQGNPNGPPPGLLDKLKREARGSVAASTEDSTKYHGFVRVAPGGDLLPGNRGNPQAKAQAFLTEYGALLGVGDSAGSLVAAGTKTDAKGAAQVTYSQVYRGVPVFGGEIRAHVDDDGSLTAVNGNVIPDLELATTPKLSAAQAGQRAVAHVIADPPLDENGNPPAFLTAGDLTAVGRPPRLPRRAGPGYPRDEPACVRGRGHERAERARVRVRACARGQDRQPLQRSRRRITSALVRRTTAGSGLERGRPVPGALNQDQQNIVNFSGHTYWIFFNAFGRDSWDGEGARDAVDQQRSAHRVPQRQLERRHDQLLRGSHG